MWGWIRGAWSLQLLVLSACSGEIFHSFNMDSGTSLSTDTRQRLVSNLAPGTASRPGLVDTNRIVCVEPRPDVAVAYAQSFGAGLSVAGKGSGSAAGASVEGLAQLAERTTAIQAILQQGYQGCIDYMNGAISATTYSLRQSRLDDLLVTLVLSENAAGAFGRSGASIGTTAHSEASAAASLLPSLSKGLEEANKDLNAKQQEVDVKTAAYNKAKSEYDALPADATNKAAKKTQMDAAEADMKLAIAARDASARAATGFTEAAAKAAAGVSSVTGQGGLTARPDPEIARVIGQMQDTFVNKDIEQAYISTCLTELGLWKIPTAEDDLVRKAGAQAVVNQGGLNRGNAQPYFYSTNTALRTNLTDNCIENLSAVVFRAQTNSNERKIMAMEIEAKRLDLELTKAATSSRELGDSIHPLATYNIAVKAMADLKSSHDKLSTRQSQIPAKNDHFKEEDRNKLVEDVKRALQSGTDLLASSNATLGSEKSGIDQLEADYLSLISDVRRSGGGPDYDLWSKEYALQQKKSDFTAEKMKKIVREANVLRAEIDALVQKIESAPKS